MEIPMATTMAVTQDVATLINILTLEPKNFPHVLALLKEVTESTITRLPGWVSTNFLASTDLRRVIIYSQWRCVEDVTAMQNNPLMRAYFPRIAALASFESVLGDVVYAHHASASSGSVGRE
jgi:hypothetical protein